MASVPAEVGDRAQELSRGDVAAAGGGEDLPTALMYTQPDYHTLQHVFGMRNIQRELTMRPHSIASAVLLWNLAACTAWHVQEGASPLLLVATEHPNVVRLTRADKTHMVLQNPRLAGVDTLAGLDNGTPSSIAVSEVTQVAIRKFSAGNTIALIVGISGVAFVIAISAAVKGGGL